MFTLKKEDANKKIATEEINNLYNMRRMSSLQYYQLADKKYSNNEFIPTISFWHEKKFFSIFFLIIIKYN